MLAEPDYQENSELILREAHPPVQRRFRERRHHFYHKGPNDSYLSDPEEDDKRSTEQAVIHQEKIKLIRITRPFRTRWDLFTMLLALYNCLTVPFFVAFYDGQQLTFFLINTAIDVVFIVDICLNFATTYIDRNGDEITEPRKVVVNYLKGFFWLDLVASLPVDNFYIHFGDISEGSEFIQLSDLLKLVRILRLGRIIRFTRTRDDVKAGIKLLQLTLYLIMWVHLTGCIWYLIVRTDEIWIPLPDYGTGETTFYSDGIWRKYFTCFYHAVWLLTGGEVGPQNSTQAFVASILIIIGALITAVLFGEMAVLMSNLNRRQTQFQEILDGALTTMNNMKLSEKLTNRILDYITSTQSSMSQQEEYETFQKFISPSLQQEVSQCLYDPIIRKNYVVKCDDKLISILTNRLHNKFTKPEEEVITEGAEADALYFLVNGECKVYVNDSNMEKKAVCLLMQGAHFGEIGVIYDSPRTATVEARGYCTIGELSKKDFESITASSPHIINSFRRCTAVYHDHWKQYLLSILQQADYFQPLPEQIFNELVYFLEIKKLERGQYLFKPGEPCTNMYLVTHGELELSLTINEKHLHLLKQQARIPGMENSPAVPKKHSTLEDYGDVHKLDVKKLYGLKNKADLITLVNAVGVVGSIYIDEHPPENTQPIGDYPQEIVLYTLKPGTLVHSSFCLLKDFHQLQCKALSNVTVYALRVDRIETLCKENQAFGKGILETRNVLNSQHAKKVADVMDVLTVSSSENSFEDYSDFLMKKNYKLLWKSAIVRLLLGNREKRKEGSSRLANMVMKLQAILCCEQAGNYELADRVMKEEIPPHYIMEDGSLDPAVSKNDVNASLPRTHPIMKSFKNIFESVVSPEGNIRNKYNTIHKVVHRQNKKLRAYDKYVADTKQQLVDTIFNMRDDYPLRSGKTPAILKEELRKLLSVQKEERRKYRRMAELEARADT